MPYQQPWLHDLTVALPPRRWSSAAPTARSGREGCRGCCTADVRVLSRAELRLDGAEPVPVAHALDGADTVRFTGIARSLGDEGADPTVRVERSRRVTPGRVEEEIRIVSFAATPVDTEAVLDLDCRSVGQRARETGPSGPAGP